MKKKFFIPLLLLQFFYWCSCNNSNTDTTAKSEASAAPEVKSVFINGDSIHYIDIGKGEPVVFIHGAVGDYRTWKTQMDDFAKNHRVISYSRRFAYPNTQTIRDSAQFTVMAHSKDLSEFLKALNLGPAHLIGHSFGASTALMTAADHPELVSSLTLGEPFFASLVLNVSGGDTVLDNFIKGTFGPVTEALKSNNDEKAVQALITGVIGDSLFYSRLPQQDRDLMMANTTELKGITFRHDVFPPITCDELKKIKPPVLLLEGDKTPRIFSVIIDELDRCLTNKEKAMLPNSSHGLEYENPAEFNKIVLGFIDKQSRSLKK